ncbi:hypothetical protein GMRT_13680 [Giardia muris]|uniref:Uncharacterized protein n=1 Tax=Giardia muris TaxID=5742 RepID=A0A4Z1T987_GIAMU|nr:hypothetical protein GMRT_13680 [Giardia muris]|eukprot:TNJ30703.1 hypothetical protein GMRT_13680 [Giardia muris]
MIKMVKFGVLQEAITLLLAGQTPLQRRITHLVAVQGALCLLALLYCLMTRYTHHYKLLYCITAMVGLTAATAEAGRNGTAAGLLGACVLVSYALSHILSRQWVFPLHVDDIHDYPLR